MPTYEYSCSKCGKSFEAVQSITSSPLETCPKELCQMAKWGKGKVKRGVGGGTGLIFKGSGFYITDYRSEGYKQAAKKDSEAPKSSSSTSSTPPPASKDSTAKPAKGSSGSGTTGKT